MSSAQSLLIGLETVLSILFIWGLIHEDKVIAFEKWVTMVVVVNYRRRKRKKAALKAKRTHTESPKIYDPLSVYEADYENVA